MSDSEVSGLKGWNAWGEICSKPFVSDSGDSGWSEFGQTSLTVFGIDSGIDLIVKSIRKKFPSCHCFRAQRIYYITVALSSYEYGAEKIPSLSNTQQMPVVQQWKLFIRTYIHLWNRCWQPAAQLRLWSALSIKMAVSQIYLQKHSGEEQLNCNCSDYFASYCRSELTPKNVLCPRNQYRTSCAANNIVNCLILQKAIFEIRRLTDILLR